MFASAVGTIIDPRNITARFDRLVARAGVKAISFHGLRHTFASVLLQKGVNIKVVSKLLGHASIAVTLDTYAHLMPGMEESAAHAIGQALAFA